MAVPKRKTSKARRDQRRAQHKIEAPRVNACPQCGSPKRAAPRLPDLRHVQGARDRAPPHPGTVESVPRIAVDALGGDRGPGEVVAGAVEAAADGIEVLIVGPPGLETSGLPLRPALE